MIQDAPSLDYDPERRLAANDGGFGILVELRRMRARLESIQKESESYRKASESRFKQLEQESESYRKVSESRFKHLESHHQSHLDLRQGAISTWVRDALNKDTPRRKKRLNKDVIYGGDMVCDALVVTERFTNTSTEWKSFSILYGLTIDEFNDLGSVYPFP
jgi:hypothetical protein